MNEYVIQKGIPMPPPKGIERQARECHFPFAQMEVGDSFAFEIAGGKVEQLRSKATAYGRKHDKKFKIRSFNNKGACWRVL